MIIFLSIFALNSDDSAWKVYGPKDKKVMQNKKKIDQQLKKGAFGLLFAYIFLAEYWHYAPTPTPY